jgi:hypothetical protein
MPGGTESKRRPDAGRCALAAVLAALALATSGCALQQVRLADLPAGQRIAVVSLLGDRLVVHHYGPTLFERSVRAENVDAWKLDAYAEMLARQALGKSASLKVVTPATDGIRKSRVEYWEDPFTGVVNFADDKQALLAAAREANADALLLLLPRDVGERWFGTLHFVKGYGMVTQAPEGNAVVYYSTSLVLIDAKAGGQLGRWSDLRSSALPQGPAKDKPLSPDVLEAAEAVFKNYVRLGLETQLAEAGLRRRRPSRRVAGRPCQPALDP